MITMENELKNRISALEESIIGMRIDIAPALLKELLDKGVPPADLLMALKRSMEIVGRKYEQSEYFLCDLIMSGEVMKAWLAALEPALEKSKIESLGTVVLGTVCGDTHDIGKNVFKLLAEPASFSVIDLEVDVASDAFVDAVQKNYARTLGLSALPSATRSIAEIVNLCSQAGIRGEVKIVAGGAPVTNEFAKSVGADAGTDNAVEGVRICKELLGA